MTITPTYPGVYVTEAPSGTRTIVGVSTSITAFVGRALRGPVNKAVAIYSFADFERSFGPLWRQSGLGYAVRAFYLNGGGPALVVRVDQEKPVDQEEFLTASVSADGLTLRALGPGSWAKELGAQVTHPATSDAEVVARSQGVSPTDLFSLTVFLGKVKVDNTIDATEKEEFQNVTVVDGPRRIDRVLESSRLVRLTGGPPETHPGAGVYVSTTPVADGDASKTDYQSGLDALETVDLVNLIVIPPPTPAIPVPDGVWVNAMDLAERTRAFLIVDPPAGTLPKDVKAWTTGPAGLVGPGARNAAVYTPQIRLADPLSGGALINTAVSGAVAGIYARTDATRGVWKAPAGIEASIVGALGPAQPITNDEQGPLNQQGVNVIRTFPDTGTVLWGTRTLRGADSLADDYKYVPVRRLALYIEESLFRGTQWVVFEPNDEPLWSQIRLSIGAFMQDLFRRGAFQGASPREAYFVRCSADTTTQYDIDRGIVNIHVGFAPLKPAEFVMITIQQKSAQE